MSTSSSGMSLREAAEKQGIEYLFAAMATLQGPTKGSFVPTAAADTLEKEGAGFLGFLYYMLPICEGKQFGRPDVTTLIKLPWKPSVAWIQWWAGSFLFALDFKVHQISWWNFDFKHTLGPYSLTSYFFRIILVFRIL